MSTYRRNYVPGGTYFFTVVTHERRPILTTPFARDCLRTALQEEAVVRPFEMIAVVLLPEHIHAIWTLPESDRAFSVRWKRIKDRFTSAYLAGGGREGTRNPSRVSRAERGVWQRRFWEHTVRDEDDLKRCLDYIHWNPVKHGLVERVDAYPWSSFGRWVAAGEYEPTWGTGEVKDVAGAEWE